MNLLKDPRDLATEIWDCLVDCHLQRIVVVEGKATLTSEDHAVAVEYIHDLIVGDRELIMRRFLNGGR